MSNMCRGLISADTCLTPQTSVLVFSLRIDTPHTKPVKMEHVPTFLGKIKTKKLFK